jgi:hypothetical protein
MRPTRPSPCDGGSIATATKVRRWCLWSAFVSKVSASVDELQFRAADARVHARRVGCAGGGVSWGTCTAALPRGGARADPGASALALPRACQEAPVCGDQW